MTDFICKKCGSTEYEIKDKNNGTGIAHGLYCAKCGFWHKWLNKQELILYDKKDSKDEIIARLEAENAELKARLEKAVELPCKLGEEIFVIVGLTPCVEEYEVTSIEIHKGIIWLRIESVDLGIQATVTLKSYGFMWFTELEQAEARLAELKGKK